MIAGCYSSVNRWQLGFQEMVVDAVGGEQVQHAFQRDPSGVVGFTNRYA